MTGYDVPSLPQALDSERSVLGVLMLDGIGALENCLRLREDMMSVDAHRKLWRVIAGMLQEGITADLMAVRADLEKRRWLEAVGGIGYVSDLSSGIPRNFDPSQHVDRIVEKWKLRQGMRICDRYTQQFAEQEPADATLALMQSEVFDAMQELSTSEDPNVRSFTVEELNRALDYETSSMGYSFGVPLLDNFTNGMQPGEVTIIGARSGVGKTSILCQAASACCKAGVGFDMFSLEMSRERILRRIWSLESGLSYRSIGKKLLNASERHHLSQTAYSVAEWPLRIHDDGELSLSQISALARLSARRNGTRVIGVDYAQIVNAEGRDERAKVSNVSRTLTKLAKKEGIHLILLSQLRKVPSDQYSKPPHVGDLRETGQLENDANTVVLLHRPWDEENSRISNEAELIIPKQRDGETGALPSRFEGKTLTFV